MKCSLVIPVYNAEFTISNCIDSAIKQSIGRNEDEYEIIIVDDGSNDKTNDIIREYPVKKIRQTNQGPAIARNNGAKVAKSDIVVFTDSDCEIDSYFLEYITTPFSDNDEIVAVQGSYKTKQREFIARFCQVEIESRYMRMLKHEYIDFIGSYAAAYRKDIFLECGGFDAGFPIASGEDSELSYKLSKKGCKMIFVPEAIIYHQHPAKLKNYLKVKYNRGYWRVKLYSMHPEKILKDSYTLQIIKYQVLSIPLLVISLGLTILNKIWLIPTFIIMVPYVIETSMFHGIFKKHEYQNNIFIPTILILRSTALFLGITSGIINGIFKRRKG